MRVLCVCRKGNVRSVEMKRVLNKRGYKDVLSVGGLTVSKKTLNMLSEWADLILLAKPSHGKNIKHNYRSKINKEFYIGDDLEIIVNKQLDKIKL